MRSFGEIHEYKEPPLHHQTDQYSKILKMYSIHVLNANSQNNVT